MMIINALLLNLTDTLKAGKFVQLFISRLVIQIKRLTD